MYITERNKKYNAYVEAKMPKTKPWPSLFRAFWVGGLICCLGELIKDLCLYFFPYMTMLAPRLATRCSIYHQLAQHFMLRSKHIAYIHHSVANVILKTVHSLSPIDVSIDIDTSKAQRLHGNLATM